MKCPVCKTEYTYEMTNCPKCGFGEMQQTFVNVSDAEHWTNTVVYEYRIKWLSTLKDFVFDETFTELLKYTGTDAHVSVPYGVHIIKDAFSDNRHIQSVDLPSSVEHIGHKAFYYCENLSVIRMHEGIKSIKEKAFEYCSKLNIILPKSVEEISERAFLFVKGISIDENSVRYKTESGMLLDVEKGVLLAVAPPSPRVDIVVPNYVCRIGSMAFMLQKNIPNSIKLPYGLKSIGEGANVCGALKVVTIPNTVEKIEDGGLGTVCQDIILEDGNPNYMKINNVIIEKETHRLISVCNKNCDRIDIPDCVRTIAQWAFQQCRSLTEIEFHNGIEEIDHFAFHNCCKLKHVIIPRSVKRIGYDIFHSCNALNEIFCGHDKKPLDWNPEWLKSCAAKIYWGNEWKFVPQPISKK